MILQNNQFYDEKNQIVGERVGTKFMPSKDLQSKHPDHIAYITAKCNKEILIHDRILQETCYMWKEWNTVQGESTPRLLTPWADPMQYEFPMDWMFNTEQDAIEAKKRYAPTENWVLCKITTEPLTYHQEEE